MTDNHIIEDPEILIFETSPYGNVDAIVQHDGRSLHFYLHENESEPGSGFGTRGCWVRNLQTAPYVFNESEIKAGISPLLPRTHCYKTEPSLLPDPDKLEIVWLEEGNGAALLEATESGTEPKLLSVIPPWSGIDGFHGYAAGCAQESTICWPLPDNPNLKNRIRRAQEFWLSFSQTADPTADPFSQLQQTLLSAYDAHWKTKSKQYFAINGDRFPPRGLVLYELTDCQVLITVAMSICPQPAVELHVDDPQRLRRIELAIRLDSNCDESKIQEVAKRMSGLAGYPWRKFNWYGHGHTVQFEGIFPEKSQVTLTHDSVCNRDNQIKLPPFRDDPLNLLWLV